METKTISKNRASRKCHTSKNSHLTSVKGGGYLTKLFVFIMAIVLMCCEQEPLNKTGLNEIQLPTDEKEVFVQNEYNLAIKDLALAVGKAMNENVELRKIVKNASIKREHGGAGVHLKEFVDKTVETVAGTSSVRKLLDASYSAIDKTNTNGFLKNSLDSFVGAILEQYPRMVISTPVNAENWNETEYMPLVAFAPEEASVETTSYLPGYDPNSDFNFVAIDAKTPPSEPLIVIVEDYSLTEER